LTEKLLGTCTELARQVSIATELDHGSRPTLTIS